jgi:pimeloyl-ACP methyl ester carboxylesterase
VNTPDLPRPPIPPIQMLRQVFPDTPIYMVGFQTRGLPEWVFSWGRGAADFVEMIYSGATTTNDAAFSEDDLDEMVRAFSPAGALTPPIEWYRNLDRNWELSAAWADRSIDVPCLMICAADDPVLTPAMAEGMEARVPNLTKLTIEQCGHWTARERPDEVNAAITKYLPTVEW